VTVGLTIQSYRKDWWTPSDNELLRTNTIKFPLLARIPHLLPQSLSMYINALVADRKHSGIKDKQDVFGNSPYTYTQLNRDLWSISYEYDMITPMLWLKNDDLFTKMFMAPLLTKVGLNFMSKEIVPELLAAAKPGQERDELEKDCNEYFGGLDNFYSNPLPPENLEERQKWWDVISIVKHTTVVKLKSGGIALYDPPRIRAEVAEWLTNNFGEVKYIISPASAHTNFMNDATKMFPTARVVASKLALLKMRNKGYKQKSTDCEYTNSEELQAENELLAAEGIELIPIKGDPAGHALILLHKPTKSLLECDINYHLWRDKVNWRVITAIFRHRSLNQSDLPIYRFIGMDHTAGLINSRLGDCGDMANSLRGVLARDFDMAYGSHVKEMDRVMFREVIDNSWNWLDGKSLLP